MRNNIGTVVEKVEPQAETIVETTHTERRRELEFLGEQLYDAPLIQGQTIVAWIGETKWITVYAQATADTIFIVEFSLDGKHWFKDYVSATPESYFNRDYRRVCKYVRLTAKAAGTPEDKVSLAVAGK